jgi:hypothetical protein
MHLVSVDLNSKSSRHQEARLRNSSCQAKDQNLGLKLQIVEAEKQTSTAPPLYEESLRGSIPHCQ